MTIVQEGWSLTLPLSPSAPLGQRSTQQSVLSTLIPSYWAEVNRTEWTNGGVAQRVDGVNSLCGLPPSPLGSLVPQLLLGWIRTSCSLWGRPLSQPTAPRAPHSRRPSELRLLGFLSPSLCCPPLTFPVPSSQPAAPPWPCIVFWPLTLSTAQGPRWS